MSTLTAESWVDLNQRHLIAALSEVRRLLEAHISGASAPSPVEPGRPGDPAAGERGAFALEAIQQGFGLSDFERLVLVLTAGPELDGSFAALCTAAHDAGAGTTVAGTTGAEKHGTGDGDRRRAFPTFSLALSALPGAHWSAITPAAPLRRWRLVHPAPGPVVAAPLSIDERVLHALTGVAAGDQDLGGMLDPVPAPSDLPPSHAELAARLSGLWEARQQPAGTRAPVPQLIAGSSGSAAEVAAAAAAGVGMALWALDARVIPGEPKAIAELARLLERETVLSATAVLIDAREAGEPERLAAIRLLLERIAAPAVLAVRDRINLGRRGTIVFEVGKPTAAEQRALWAAAAQAQAAQAAQAAQTAKATPTSRATVPADTLAAQFDLDSATIRSLAAGAAGEPTGDDLWDATRALTRPRLGALAQRMDTSPSWDQLILPAHQRDLLGQIALHVRHRLTVHETWGFGRGSRRGSGTAALFAGPSGTGKTLAAQVLATELRLDLFRVDLASVLSKYIGETEKNLGALFDAADEGAVVLLFDEADALFGRRSEVKDSHDRYANLEISYLLQRIEEQRGLVLLTTNMREALDPAFLRRLRFVVEFPFPDHASRAEMWRRVFPPEAPVAPIDAEALGMLNLSGAGIRNVAVSAAVLAAEEGVPLGMSHLERAARTECAKLDQPFPLRA
ncbi:MAG TPA: ATP-binding protein, partial [Actinomycetota bacterium]|nr:ATP-binding protein [Actinomycetota bacterium]